MILQAVGFIQPGPMVFFRPTHDEKYTQVKMGLSSASSPSTVSSLIDRFFRTVTFSRSESDSRIGFLPSPDCSTISSSFSILCVNTHLSSLRRTLLSSRTCEITMGFHHLRMYFTRKDFLWLWMEYPSCQGAITIDSAVLGRRNRAPSNGGMWFARSTTSFPPTRLMTPLPTTTMAKPLCSK